MQNAKVRKVIGDSAVNKEAKPLIYKAAQAAGSRVAEQAAADLRDRTTKYARRVIRLYVNLPKDSVSQILGKQLLRSGTSVGANYRECCRGRSKAEFTAKLGDCLRERDETAYWLELLQTEQIIPPKDLLSLQRETNELTAIFVPSLKSARS